MLVNHKIQIFWIFRNFIPKPQFNFQDRTPRVRFRPLQGSYLFSYRLEVSARGRGYRFGLLRRRGDILSLWRTVFSPPSGTSNIPPTESLPDLISSPSGVRFSLPPFSPQKKQEAPHTPCKLSHKPKSSHPSQKKPHLLHIRKPLHSLSKILNRLIRIPMLNTISHTMLDMPLKHNLPNLMQSRLRRIDLSQNILARNILIHHPIDRLHLPNDLLKSPVKVLRVHTLLHTITSNIKNHSQQTSALQSHQLSLSLLY